MALRAADPERYERLLELAERVVDLRASAGDPLSISARAEFRNDAN